MKKSKQSSLQNQRHKNDAWEPSGVVQGKPSGQLRKGGSLSGDKVLQMLARTTVQHKGDASTGADAVKQHAASGIQGSAQSLPHIEAIQHSFGRHDVSGIQSYQGSAAKDANQKMGSLAYATGNSIAFKNAPDLHTAAHEAAHIVQQRGGVTGLNNGVGKVGDSYEVHADAVADRVVQGRSAEELLSQSPGGRTGLQFKRSTDDIQFKVDTVQFEDDPKPSGVVKSTDFGEYWVVPNDTDQSFEDAVGEQITKSNFDTLKGHWDAIKAGSGNIKIGETDPDGNAVSGFKTSILEKLGKLMSKPTGRAVVVEIMDGSKTTTIKPAKAGRIAYARRGEGSLQNADGTAGAGGDSTIFIDPTLEDDTVVAFDKDGNELDSPVFLILGHELIHATHNAAGTNRRSESPTEAAYGNKEEEETINTGEQTENMIRAEHGVEGPRHGHRGAMRSAD